MLGFVLRGSFFSTGTAGVVGPNSIKLFLLEGGYFEFGFTHPVRRRTSQWCDTNQRVARDRQTFWEARVASDALIARTTSEPVDWTELRKERFR